MGRRLPQYPDYVIERARQMWLAGDFAHVIAAACDVRDDRVYGWARAYGWPKRRRGKGGAMQYVQDPTPDEIAERVAEIQARRQLTERNDSARAGIRRYTFTNGHFEGVSG